MNINLPDPQSVLGQLIDPRWLAELITNIDSVPKLHDSMQQATMNLLKSTIVKSSFAAAKMYGVTGETLVLLRFKRVEPNVVHTSIVFDFGKVRDLKGGR